MDSRCPWGNKLVKKEERDSEKNKSIDSAHANIFSGKQSSCTQQTSPANPKKDQDHQQGFWCHGGQGQSCNPDFPTTGVNIVPKKKRDIS